VAVEAGESRPLDELRQVGDSGLADPPLAHADVIDMPLTLVRDTAVAAMTTV
jgi:hypothetical protein